MIIQVQKMKFKIVSKNENLVLTKSIIETNIKIQVQKLKRKEGEGMTAIKKFRESQGMKQEDFAAIIKVSKVNYCKKENGKVKFSLDEAFLISKYFNKPIESIFGNNEVSC